MPLTVFLAALLLALSAPAMAQSGCAGVTPAPVTEIAPGVYVRQGQHGPPFVTPAMANVGFVVGRECVAVIDTGGSPEEGRALRCAVANTTAVPVCYLIITHHHFDHALGSLAFKTAPQVQLIGHAKLGPALALSADYYLQQLAAASGQTFSKELIVTPDQTVAVGASHTLDLGGRELLVQAHPPAHSGNDLSVFDPQTGTLWLSDLLFVDHIPTLDGSVLGWLEVLAALKRTPARRAVPGHGPTSVGWPQGADDTERYFTVLRDQTRRLLDEGAGLEQARDQVGLDEQDRWQLFDLHHKRNVIKVYTELEWE